MCFAVEAGQRAAAQGVGHGVADHAGRHAEALGHDRIEGQGQLVALALVAAAVEHRDHALDLLELGDERGLDVLHAAVVVAVDEHREAVVGAAVGLGELRALDPPGRGRQL